MDLPTPPRPAGSRVGAVIALKATAYAKSRLGTLPDPVRRRLAWTMAVDTLRAVRSVVDEVVVVGDQPGVRAALRAYGVDVVALAEPAAGMNAALTHGAEHLRRHGSTTVLACVGDLPSVRASSLETVVSVSRALAEVTPRAFLADASGVGTTVLIAHDVALDPRFQGRSAAAHRISGAVSLGADLLGGPLADARRDVDGEPDLADTYHLGLGPTTAALFDPATQRLGRYVPITVVGAAAGPTVGPGGDDHRAVTNDGVRVLLPQGSLDQALLEARAGQRLHAMINRTTVLSAWL